MRVVAIDPAPGKKSTVFNGVEFSQLDVLELGEFIKQLVAGKEPALVCWDAPLTGPFDPANAGSHYSDFTQRPIERFFSRSESGFKRPEGISVLGYAGCPHWTISRSLLGLPRVGPFDTQQSRLPLKLISETNTELKSRPSVVEIHPALAAWLWCRTVRDPEASWVYKGTKGNKAERRKIQDEMWEIVLDRCGLDECLPQPRTDDEFDAAIGYILGKSFVQDGKRAPRRCLLLGDQAHGTFLLPNVRGLADAWMRWRVADGVKSIRTRSTAANARQFSANVKALPQFANQVGSQARSSTGAAIDVASNAVKQTANVAGDAFSRAKAGPKRAFASAATLADELLATVQGLLASSLAVDLNDLLQATVKGSATVYDKAMDAEYLRTFVGGGNHRLFDHGHTVAGAWEAVRNASPDDSFIEEALGFAEAIFKDLTTPKGLPIANWDKATYDSTAAYLQSNFGIPKDWFYDINSYDAPELLAGAIGLVSVVFSWNEKDTEKFSKLVGNMGVAAVFSANPVLMIVTLTSLSRAFHKAEHSGEYVEAVDGLLKGGIGTGATLAAAAQIAVFGGPAGLTLLTGLTAGILVNRATKDLSVAQLHQFILERTTAAATEISGLVQAGT